MVMPVLVSGQSSARALLSDPFSSVGCDGLDKVTAWKGVVMLIDCDTCEVRGDACGDCMVTALLGIPKPVDLADDEASALGALSEAGLLPPLRLVSRAPETGPESSCGRESA